MTIEASFSWRLLHRCFLEGNGVRFSNWFSDFLPMNGGELMLESALSVIRLKCIKDGIIDESQVLNLFLGVDEYQSINEVGGIKIGEEDLLQELLNVLGNVMASPVEGLLIYPMFAGTDFSVISKVNRSRTESLPMPMYLLSQYEVENIIHAVPNGDRLLLHGPVRRHLFYLGGVPRWVIEYILPLLEGLESIKSDDFLSIEYLEGMFEIIRIVYIDKLSKLPGPQNLIKLAAYAISGIEVAEDATDVGSMTWSQVRDKSLCVLNMKSRVMIPYSFLHHIAKYNFTSEDPEVLRCFVVCIKGLIKQVDMLIYEKEPWQLWEVFGAYFHALRINSLLIISNDIIPISQVFKGALIKGCDYEVKLRPMVVVETTDKFLVEIPRNVGRKGNYFEQYDWFDQGVVVLNGEGGTGVDLFFALEKGNSKEYVVFVDQRKRVAGNNLGPISVKKLLQKAEIMPVVVPAGSTLVKGLFSCVTDSNVGLDDLIPDSIVVSYSQNELYHGTLWTHPAAYPFVRINTDTSASIQMLFKGKQKREMSAAILSERKKQKFTTVDDFKRFTDAQKLDTELITDFEPRISFC